MIRIFGAAFGLVLVLGLARIGHAQTLPYDHVHLAVGDPDKAVEWYITNLGATRSPRPDRVLFGEVLFIFQRAEGREPSAGGPVDHVGFSVQNPEVTMRQLEQAGGRVAARVADIPRVFRSGFIDDPWGVRLEILEDPPTLGFHHIHLQSPSPDATLKWYETMFGGDRLAFKGGFEALKYGPVWLMLRQGAIAAGRRAVDHLSWRVTSVDETIATLKTRNVNVVTEPGPSPGGNRVAFIEDPAGVRIEIMQRPQ